MKRHLLVLLPLFMISAGFAQSADFVTKKDLQSETKKINEVNQTTRRTVNEMKKVIAVQQVTTDSLLKIVAAAQEKAAGAADASGATAAKITTLQADLQRSREVNSNGMIIMGVIMLFFITLGFFYSRMISTRIGRRIEDLSDLLSSLSETSGKEIQELKTISGENKDHLLFLSDELKALSAKINNNTENDRERAAMMEEKIKHIGLESEINLKVTREKFIAMHNELEKSIADFDEKFKQTNLHLENEMIRIGKLVKPDMEKEKLV